MAPPAPSPHSIGHKFCCKQAWWCPCYGTHLSVRRRRNFARWKWRVASSAISSSACGMTLRLTAISPALPTRILFVHAWGRRVGSISQPHDGENLSQMRFAISALSGPPRYRKRRGPRPLNRPTNVRASTRVLDVGENNAAITRMGNAAEATTVVAPTSANGSIKTKSTDYPYPSGSTRDARRKHTPEHLPRREDAPRALLPRLSSLSCQQCPHQTHFSQLASRPRQQLASVFRHSLRPQRTFFFAATLPFR